MESSTAGLGEIGETIQEALESEAESAEPIRIARAQLLRHVTVGDRQRNFSIGATIAAHPWRTLGLTGALLTVLGAWLWLGPTVSFDVGTRAVAGRLGDVVQAQGAEPMPLRFSEGSTIVLREGGRARVLTADGAGARVLLENGEADVAIAHRTRRATRWSFEAGPFHVLVTGTKFKVAWNSMNQALALATKEGSVLVSAPCLDAPRVVSAGHSVQLSCRKPSSAPEPEPEPAAAPAASLPAPSVERAAVAVIPAPRASEEGWREPLRAGRLAEALRAAEGSGFTQVCERATGAELLALADAARLSGSAARATTALLALRRRFSRSGEAATAAFALGRIAFDQRADYADAARWFKAYLEQLPNGPLMGDAAGRLMEARFRQGDREGARGEAQRYLTRFPVGPYASQARKILSE